MSSLWGLEQALISNSAQEAVETIHRVSPRLLGYEDEKGDLNALLGQICELLALDSDFIEEEQEGRR